MAMTKKTTTADILAQTQKLYSEMQDAEAMSAAAAAENETELNNLKLSNAERLHRVIMQQLDAQGKKEIENEERNFKLSQQLIQKGFSVKAALDSKAAMESKQKISALNAEEQAKLKKAGSKEEKDKIKREYAEKRKAEKKHLVESIKNMDKETRKAFNARQKDETKARLASVQEEMGAYDQYGKAGKLIGFASGLKKLKEEGASKSEVAQAAISTGMDAIGNYAKKLEADMRDVAMAQGKIDTQLQGSKHSKNFLGSYWQDLNSTISQNVGISPFVQQKDVVGKLKDLVGQGISFNVEQRAFLETIKDKIATTFDVADGTLRKLVRIQQADSSAARLGMESALTSFLNNMYETTEYMQQAADSIRANIYEASALMDAEEATEFEYQVQKWMGSLYSVGFNSSEGLSGALGKLAAGDISGITDGGYGNLLVMAANKANLSIAEILADGLDDSSTNALMQAMVEYLGGIYDETKDNKVVAQQFANVYGLTASDLKAAANLASSTTNISKNNVSYGGMLTQLNTMADTMWKRTSMGEMMTNLFDNFNYTMASQMGSNPALYTIYTLGGMLEDTTGGIDIPAISVMGSGFDLNTSVAQLMQVGAMSGGILGGIGQLISGLAKGSGGGFSGSGMLKAFGVNTSGTSTVVRGNGGDLTPVTSSGGDTSLSGFIGNEDGSAVYDKILTDANDDGNKKLAQAIEDSTETTMSTVDEHIVQIYTLLQDVVTGSSKLHITVEGDSGWSTSGYTPSGVPML